MIAGSSRAVRLASRRFWPHPKDAPPAWNAEHVAEEESRPTADDVLNHDEQIVSRIRTADGKTPLAGLGKVREELDKVRVVRFPAD